MSITDAQLKSIYEAEFSSINKREEIPQIKAEFYSYVGINNRIRLRDGVLYIRVSDILREAPLEFHTALAQILLRKLYRKRIPESVLHIYREYIKQAEVRDRSIENRRLRGRKVISGAHGDAYDLNEIFDFLNLVYFPNRIPKPALSWSAGKTFRILGHHDATHGAIIISKSLDDKKVPRYVLEYIVYHEMLHIKHPTRYENGRRYNHTPEFKRDEREFAFYEEAEKWIEENAGALRKAAKRSRK